MQERQTRHELDLNETCHQCVEEDDNGETNMTDPKLLAEVDHIPRTVLSPSVTPPEEVWTLERFDRTIWRILERRQPC